MSEMLGVQLRRHGWPEDAEDEDAAARRWQRATQEAFQSAGSKITVLAKPLWKLEERVREVVKQLNKEGVGAKPGDMRSWEHDFLAVELLRPGSHSGGLRRQAVVMGEKETGAAAAKRAFAGALSGYCEGVGACDVDDDVSDAVDDDPVAYKRDSDRTDLRAAPPVFLRGVAEPDASPGFHGINEAYKVLSDPVKKRLHDAPPIVGGARKDAPVEVSSGDEGEGGGSRKRRAEREAGRAPPKLSRGGGMVDALKASSDARMELGNRAL
ncbi:hypothetical protein T484DRAFT_1922237, partial [Baffinella frigidus]